MHVPTEYVCGAHRNITSENLGSSYLDLELGDIPLLSRYDLDSHTNIVVVGKMLQLLMTLIED